MDRDTQLNDLFSRLEANPHDLTAVREVERSLNGRGDDLVEALATAAAQADEAEVAARLYLEAGRKAAIELGDVERGLALVAKSLEVGAETLVSVEAHLFDLALKGEGETLFGFFSEALESLQEAPEQSRLYFQMGTILEGLIGEEGEGQNAYQYAVDLDPANMAARWASQALAERNENWAKVAELVYDEIEFVEQPDRKARLCADLGEIYRDKLGDQEGAEQCFGFAYELDPNEARARAALLDMGYDLDEISEALEVEPAEIGSDDNPQTMELDEDMLVDEAPAPPSTEDRPETMELDDEMLVEESEVEGPPPFAVAEDEPPAAPPEVPVGYANGDSELEAELEANGAAYAEPSGAEELEVDDLDVDELDEAEPSEVDTADEDEALELDAADAASQVEEVEEVEGEESEAEAMAAADEEAGEEAEAVEAEEAEETWFDRFAALREQARVESGEDALRLLVRAARLQSRHPDNREHALALWADAADADADVLEGFYRRTGYLHDANDFWTAALERIDDDGVAARITFYELGDPEAAGALAEAAGDEGILSALEDLEDAKANWRKYQRALEQRYDELSGDEKAMTVYLRMADMAVALGDLDKEIDALRRLDRQVDNPLVSNRLKVLYKKAEKWPMYVDLVKKEVEALGEDRVADKIDLLHEAIRVYRDEMNHDMMVVNTYKEILEIDEENLEAIDALIELYDKLNRASELINMLQAKAEIVRTEEARVGIYEQIAELFLEKFRNQAEAIKAYEQILELRPHHPAAIGFLKEMYEKRRDWEKLIEVYKTEIETFETDAEKAAGFKEVAELATDRLRKPEVAAELWIEVRRFAPDDLDALDALETLYEKSRNYEALADVLETKVEHIDDADQKMKIFQKLGMLYSDRLEDTGRAIAAWRGALELEPDDLKARKALERLYIDQQDWDALEAFYGETGEAKDLVRVLETLAGTMKEDEVKIELLLRAARIWREELDETPRAERDLERALSIDAQHEGAARALEPIYAEKDDFQKLGEVYSIVLSHQEEVDERRVYQLKLAELHRGALDDAAGAFRWYAEAYSESPDAVELVEPLEQVAAEAGLWERLVDVYGQALQAGHDEAVEIGLRLSLGRVLSEELDQLDDALAQFEAVLEIADDNDQALAAMEDIYRRDERWDDLMDIYRRRLELTEDVDARVSILHGMGRIAEVQAGDVETAIERYREGLELDPYNEATLGELHRLYAERAEYPELADVIRREIEIVEQRAVERGRARKAARAVDPATLVSPGAEVDAPADQAGFEAEAFEREGLGVESSVPDLAETTDEPSFAEELDAEGLAETTSEVALADELSEHEPVEEEGFEAADEDVAFEDDALAEPSEASAVGVEDEEMVAEVDADQGEPSEAVEAGGEAAPLYDEADIERLVALRYELGVVCKIHLGEDDEAVEQLALVLAWRPTHAQARDAIVSYLTDEARRDTVAAALAPVYEVQGQWHQLIEVLEIRAEEADAVERSVELLKRIGHVQVVEIGETEAAFGTYAQLLRTEPADAEGRREIRRVAAGIDAWTRLVEVFEELLPQIEDEALRTEYLFAVAEVYGTYLDDPATAQGLYLEILDAAPDNRRALDELEALYASTEQWSEMRDVYERKLALAEEAGDVEQIEDLHFRTAVLWEQLLDDPHKAIETVQSVLDADPQNLRAVRALNRLYRGQQMWDELVASIESELELVEADQINAVKNRLAAVNADHLEAYDRAVDLYEEVIGDDEHDAEATAALESLMHVAGAPRGRASRILEPLYVERDEWQKLVEALEVQVDDSDDDDERVELLHRVAELWEQRAQRNLDAFQTYARALHWGPARQDTLDELYRLARVIGDWAALEAVFAGEADAQTEPEVKRDMLWRASTIAIERLGELEQAAGYLHRILEFADDDLESVEKLEQIYRRLHDQSELVEVLVKKAELVEPAEDKKQLLYQAGTIYQDILERPEDAISVYCQVLEVDPADAHAIDQLEVLYKDLERWVDLLEIYRRKLGLAEDDESKKDLLYVIGPIHREHLDEPFEAIETYQRILAIDDQEMAALERLAELYADTDQHHELLETLERQKELAQLADDQLDLRYRIGRLWETELGDVMRAIEEYRGVLAEAPDHADTTAALEGLVERGEFEVEAAQVLEPIYEDAGQWEKLVHVWRLLIDASQEPERKLELYGQIGQVYQDRLGDVRQAFEAYVEALEVAPGRTELLDTLEQLAAALQAYDELVVHFDEALEGVADYEAVTELHLRVARIQETELDEAQAAIERYNRVLEVDPENEQAILALDRLYQTEMQFEQLAEILRTRIMATTEPNEMLELRLRLGMVYQEALEQPHEAIEVYQTILMEDPDNADAIASLEQMFMIGQAVQKIADILEPHYLEKGQHEKLVEIYLRRLEQIEDRFERFDMLMQVGRIYLEELADEQRALGAYGAALAEKPDDEQVAERVGELAESTQAWDVAAGHYVEALEREDLDPEAALSLWVNLAQILDEHLEQPGEAEGAYLQALEIEPDDARALAALDHIYLDQGRYGELADVLQRRIQGTYDEDEIIALSARLARVFQVELDEPARAVDTYRNILDIRPSHHDALKALEQIHTNQQQWEELFRVLERQAEATHDPDEQSELLSRMANLAEQMLERPLDAIDLWNRVREIDPTDRQALSQLRRLYLDEQRWNDLVQVLEQQVELAEEDAERLQLYGSLGTIWRDQLDNELQALESFQKVLEIEPTHLDALHAVRDIFTRQGDYMELAGVLRRLIDHEMVADEDKLALWIELGEIQTDMLMQPEEAIEAWNHVIQMDPGNALALENLERLYLQESRWAEAAQVLDVKADRTDDEAERIHILERIADIWENKLLERENAAAFYAQILELDPTHMQASTALESIYLERGDEEALTELVSLLLDRAAVLADQPFERVETLRRAARVFEEQLQQPESALVVLLSAFSTETLDDVELTEHLERLARQTGMWADLVERYTEVVGELGESIDAADLHRRIGQWRADELDQPDDAVYHLRRALGIEPDNVEVLAKLEELYRDLASWPELADVLHKRIELTTAPDERIELWRRLGELYEMQMAEIDQAIDAYRQILAIDEADLLAMESLERIFEAYDRWDDLIDILGRKAQSTYDPEEVIRIKSRIALIYEEHQQDYEAAIDAWRDVLTVDQAHEPSLEALERLFMQTEQWNELLGVFEDRLALTHEPDGQVVLYGKMAAVLEDQFADLHSAVDAYRNITTVDPSHTGAFDNLERLHRQLENWFDLADVLQQHVEVVEDEHRRVELLNELGRVQRDELNDPHAAIEALSKSAEIAPTQADVLAELATLYEQTDGWDNAVETYERLIALSDDAAEEAELHYTRGRILEEHLLDDERAEQSLQSALRLVPGHEPSIDALRGVYQRQADWQGLIQTLKTAEEHSKDLAQKAQYLAEIGRAYEDHLDDRLSALNYYEQALEQDPGVVAAAEPLIDMYMHEQRWERTVPLLEKVIADYEQRDDVAPELLHQRHLQMARVYEKLTQDDHALEYFRRAYEMDPTDFDTLRGLSRLLFEREDFEKASQVLQNLEFQHVDKLDNDALVELYYRQGVIRQRFGENRKAAEYFMNALGVDGHHRPSLEALIELEEQQANWENVVEYTRRILESDDDPTARFALLSRMGDLLATKIEDRARAVHAYLEALDIEPKSVVILRKLLDLYTKTSQWIEAVEILDRLIEQEDDEGRRAKYYYTIGVLNRDEIHDTDAAVEAFDAALDSDVKMLKAFEAIDRILTEQKEWKELERAYRRMLKRVAERSDPELDNIKALLWRNLGEIYRSRLGHMKSAISAYKMAADITPEDESIRLILAELYERSGDDPLGAIEQHKELIQMDPFRIDSYRALFKAYIKAKEYDRAWCMAAALSFLQSASDQEENFYQKYLGSGLQAAKGTFNPELLQRLYYPDQDLIISYIMNVLAQGLRDYYSQNVKKAWGLHRKKDLLDLEQQTLFNRIYTYAARTLSVVPAPRVYLNKTQAMGVVNGMLNPPALIVGADMMQNRGDRELAFILGKHLALMRPEHYLASAPLPTENLKLLFMGAMHVTDPSLGIGPSLGEAGVGVIREIQSMAPNVLMQLQKYMKQYLAKGENPNLSAWRNHVEHTAIRAGLVLCGDLHQSASCIKNDTNPVGKATPKEKIRELVLFSISDEYFQIREALGLAIGK